MQSEPVGDVYRLYLEQGRQAQDVRILQDALHHLTERVASLTSRVVNLEPVTGTSALAVMGDGKVVDISALGDTYTESTLLRRVFSADGNPLYNTTEPSQPTGFARGKFPENADPTTLLYVCGDDYNEVSSCNPLVLCTRYERSLAHPRGHFTQHSVSVFRHLLYPAALRRAEHGDGISLYMTRCGRERTEDEIDADSLQLASSPSVLLEFCGFKSLGYTAFLLMATMLAHGRKTFLLHPDESQDANRFRKDMDETNFIGPRTKITERVRQLELERLTAAVEEAYTKHFAHSVTRVVQGVQKFSNEVALAHIGYLQRHEEPTDPGFCAAWFTAADKIETRSDVAMIYKAIMAVILHERGVNIASPPAMEEHMRVLMEAKNTPPTQSFSGRNVELKIAFLEAVNASPILRQTLSP